MLTTKKLHVKSIIHELLWFLSGDTNIGYLNETGSIWNEWADENGDLGPFMAANGEWQTSDGRHIDQISQLVAQLTSNPESRRHIVTAWNPADVDDMALPPCTACFSFMWPTASCHASFTSVRRIFFWASLQHCLLCAADTDAGAGLRSGGRRFRAHAG